MAWDNIPRIYSFSLGDFRDFDHCIFRFFVFHHLNKKYELAQGSFNQALGTLLDVTIKKIHQTKAYNQPLEYFPNIIKAAENEIRQTVAKNGKLSFYGAIVDFLTPELFNRACEVFNSYYQQSGGKFQTSISNTTFWQRLITASGTFKVWGGADTLELGEDGVPEVVDYKYFEDHSQGRDSLDMELMPKLYTYLCAPELVKNGYHKARFKIRFWQNPTDESLSQEFDLNNLDYIEDYCRNKIETILNTRQLSFCDKPFCKVCHSHNRASWILELQLMGFIDKPLIENQQLN